MPEALAVQEIGTQATRSSVQGRASSPRLAALLLAALEAGCGTINQPPPGQIVPASPSDYEFTVQAPRAKVFDSLLAVAQELNLSVDVIDRESGFLQFKHSSLSAAQLDAYCEYPAVRWTAKDTGTRKEAVDTFVGWNARSIKAGLGSVIGTLSLNALIAPTGESTHVKLHGSWISSNRNETTPVNSNSSLERDLESKLRLRAEAPPS